MKATEIADRLNLKPHPEGGFYSETFRDSSINLLQSQLPSQYKVDRPISTCIYFLLPSGSASHLHRIPCAETWHFYRGEPLVADMLRLTNKANSSTSSPKVFELTHSGDVKQTVLGSDIEAGHKLQYTVPPNVWFGSYPKMDIQNTPGDGNSVSVVPRDPENHYSLVGCTCAPAFQFEDFELAKRSELLAFAPKAEAFISYLTFPE